LNDLPSLLKISKNLHVGKVEQKIITFEDKVDKHFEEIYSEVESMFLAAKHHIHEMNGFTHPFLKDTRKTSCMEEDEETTISAKLNKENLQEGKLEF